jgi:tetratricopeptide (TPR) repeat protein
VSRADLPRRALGTLLMLLVVSMVALRGVAQEARTPANTDTAESASSSAAERAARERAAKAAFEAGVSAAEAGDYAEARSLFLRSRALVVKASTLLNLAVVDLKLGLVDEALFALDALDVPTAGPQHARLLERARELRDQAEQLRQLEAAAPVAPSTPSASAELAPAASAPPLAEGPSAAPAPGPAARSEPRPSLLAPRTLVSVGGALAAATIGAALWWSDRSQKLDECQKELNVVCLERAQIERQQRGAMALTVTLGVSALGLLTGGGIWLAQRKRDQRTRASLSVWGPRRGLGMRAIVTF